MATSSVAAQQVDRVVAATYAPLMIEGDTDYPGFAVEVFIEAAKRAGRDYQITFMPFSRALATLRSDNAVLMPALFFGKKRNDEFLWLVQIQVAELVFATLDGQIDNLDQARALGSIVVENGVTADAMLTSLGFENLVRVNNPRSSAQMLNHGRVDAWFQDDRTISLLWRELDLSGQPNFGEVIRKVPIYLVASKALDSEIADAYRTAIKDMQIDGTLDTIWARYDPNR